MILIIIYLLAFLCGLVFFLIYSIDPNAAPWVLSNQLILHCAISGGVGGILYCIRGVYLNKALRKKWDKDWHVWYFLRPIASMIAGTASFIFLKAGLLILESKVTDNSSSLGFYALAFIAGLNVDKFVEKIEEIAQTAWGIKKSRASGGNDSEKDD